MIFVDASRYGNTPQRTGVENYSVHLINALVKLAPDHITLISPRKVPLKTPQRVIPFPRLWTQARLSFEVLKNAALQKGTLFIPSHQMPMIHPARTVITIHDVAFRRFPECYGWASRMYLDWGTRFAVKHAQKIIVPSQATKNDLIEFYGAPADKIVVIPHGYTPLMSSRATVEGSRSLGSPAIGGISRDDKEKYFLFLGRIERKKNLLTLILAFNQFQKNHPDWQLVLAGKPGVGGDEIIAAARQNPAITLPGYVDEGRKIALLQKASAFIFPSLYEGFGLPLLEAMEFDLPIIASDIPASREVAGNAALYFNPTNAEELLSQIECVINDPPSTDKYAQILSRHSWEECGKKTLAHLEGAAFS